jgi:L-alanine-DL-glutamate epimerase-like enolase superfamily enzyme
MYTGSAMTGRRGLGVCAIGAVDMALWDLRGKALGEPVWRLLGGACRDRVTPYASILPDGNTLTEYTDGLVQRTVAARDLGFRAAKLEICIHGPYSHNGLQVLDDRVIASMVRECRRAVGPDLTLMVDVAYCWSDWKAALRAIDLFAVEDVFFVETPLPSDDVEGYARLCQTSPVRIAAGEWLNTRFEFRELLDRGALDVVQPDVGRVGGLTEARRVALMARDRGVLVVPHCWKSAIGIAASVHLGAIAPTCSHIEFLPAALSDSRLRKELVRNELPVENGLIPLPTRPGLGVDVDDEVLKKFAVD